MIYCYSQLKSIVHSKFFNFFFFNLKEPLGVVMMGQLVVEVLRSATEQVSSFSVCEAPAYGPVRQSSYEGVQHVLDENVDGVLGSEGVERLQCTLIS